MFFLGAAGVTALVGLLGALASWANRRGLRPHAVAARHPVVGPDRAPRGAAASRLRRGGADWTCAAAPRRGRLQRAPAPSRADAALQRPSWRPRSDAAELRDHRSLSLAGPHGQDVPEFHRRRVGRARQPAPISRTATRPNTARPDRALSRLRRRATSTRRSARPSAGFALWSRTPAPARGDVLRRVGDLLVERKEAIADAMTREMGKVLAETRGDVQEGIDTAYYAATEGRRLFGHTVPSELRSKWAMSYPPADRRRRPHHAVQLPAGDPDLEDVSGAALRELGDHQAVRGRAAHGAPAGGDPARGRAAARGHPAGARPRRDGGQGAGGASRRCRSSPSPAPPRPAPSSARPAAGCTSGSRSRWAARTP